MEDADNKLENSHKPIYNKVQPTTFKYGIYTNSLTGSLELEHGLLFKTT